ncbi:MAG: hypothetical protein AAGA56_04440 [Myxococcota bacterium]
MGSVHLAGEERGHSRAHAFAEVVREVHHRYATDVVGAYALCPHMKDPQKAFGRFCVMLTRRLDVDAAVAEVLAAAGEVTHLVYPLLEVDCTPFERFGSAVHEALAKTGREAPVHATFHPQMEGDLESASRFVGFVRRAPDPFLQFVPSGLQPGGTQYVDLSTIDWETFVPPAAPRADRSFDRLGAAGRERIRDAIVGIQEERRTRYAAFGWAGASPLSGA